MSTGSENAIARLLEETLAAHSEYETTTLGGVYDAAWAGWYAAHLLEHGLRELLPHADTLDPAGLGAILSRLDAGFRREHPERAEGEWPAYYAARLGAMVGEVRDDDPGNRPAPTARRTPG